MSDISDTGDTSGSKDKNGYDNMNFEDALGKLETIVKALESGTIPLDRSLEGFERGIQLIRRCNYLLDTAEKRVKILTRAENGEVAEVDFEA